MDNEKKIMGEEEATLTPEEKVQADIEAKIADAAAEIEEEINEANGIVEEATEEIAEELTEDIEALEDFAEMVEEYIKPEPVMVTLKKRNLILSWVAAFVAGILAIVAIFSVPKLIELLPEGSTVAKVNGEEITDLDVSYYIYAEAMNVANEESLTMDQIADYDWDKEVDGAKLSDTIKQKAVDAAINEVLTIQKGSEAGVVMDDDTKSQIQSQISGITASYGKDGFTLRARTMGIPSIKQYEKMYNKVMLQQQVQQDMEANADKYYPEDKTVLNDYTQDGKASVKHILIKNAAEGDTEDKQAKAQSILDRIKNGEDFDALMAEFNEDTGEPESGYTFGEGEMVPEFETASFDLKIGDVSEVVASTHGYHIIKRVAGANELQGYWRSSSKVSIKERKIAKLSVKDILEDIVSANKELEAETAQ